MGKMKGGKGLGKWGVLRERDRGRYVGVCFPIRVLCFGWLREGGKGRARRKRESWIMERRKGKENPSTKWEKRVNLVLRLKKKI